MPSLVNCDSHILLFLILVTSMIIKVFKKLEEFTCLHYDIKKGVLTATPIMNCKSSIDFQEKKLSSYGTAEKVFDYRVYIFTF